MRRLAITKNVNEANFITHGGTAHGDDIFASVILAKVAEMQGKDFVLARVRNVPVNISDDVIVYDIGGGKYDHHQKGGNGARANGVPYASCGLIWRDFGHFLLKDVENPEMVWRIVDKGIIQGIDAGDNGDLPKMEYPAYVMSVSAAVASFNPTWDSDEDPDETFLKSLKIAEVLFDNILKSAIAKAKAQSIVEKAIGESDGQILVLERFVPWQEAIFASENPKAAEILFVVFPSDRGGYNWQGVPDYLGSYNQRKPSPKKWWGQPAKVLQKITGVDTATFCHNNGFLGAADTLEDATKMARLAIDA